MAGKNVFDNTGCLVDTVYGDQEFRQLAARDDIVGETLNGLAKQMLGVCVAIRQVGKKQCQLGALFWILREAADRFPANQLGCLERTLRGKCLPPKNPDIRAPLKILLFRASSI